MTKEAYLIASLSDNLASILSKVTENKINNETHGFVVVLNDGVLKGVVTSSDLIREVAHGTSLELNVTEFMSREPIVYMTADGSYAFDEILSFIKKLEKVPQFLPIVDEQNYLRTVVTTSSLLLFNRIDQSVSVYGMGFVGLTLAVACASRGFDVIGIDINKDLIHDLNHGVVHIHEEGLNQSLEAALQNNKISFTAESDGKASGVHIIAVGTPIIDGHANLEYLKKAVVSVSKNLKSKDIVIIRSTVPVGTCTEVIIPLIEALTGLSEGVDFHLVFAPERTIEGNAFFEIFSLPQIIGSNSEAAATIAGQFFSKLTERIIFVDGIRESEFCKLLNNSYRDMTFAFANSFALTAKNLNIDSVALLKAASFNYPRGKIPYPSPGVGGYCLTKDPYIYTASQGQNNLTKDFVELGRKINDKAKFLPLRCLTEFETNYLDGSLASVLIIGAAFKGSPPTNDMRGSTSIELGKYLESEERQVYYKDNVVTDNELVLNGLVPFDSELHNIDAILVLNNHSENLSDELIEFANGNGTTLFYDAWSLFQKSSFSDNVNYSTLTKNYW